MLLHGVTVLRDDQASRNETIDPFGESLRIVLEARRFAVDLVSGESLLTILLGLIEGRLRPRALLLFQCELRLPLIGFPLQQRIPEATLHPFSHAGERGVLAGTVTGDLTNDAAHAGLRQVVG
jgi:hypothetical protein